MGLPVVRVGASLSLPVAQAPAERTSWGPATRASEERKISGIKVRAVSFTRAWRRSESEDRDAEQMVRAEDADDHPSRSHQNDVGTLHCQNQDIKQISHHERNLVNVGVCILSANHACELAAYVLMTSRLSDLNKFV